MQGDYAPIPTGDEHVFAFARWTGDEQLIVISNFDSEEEQDLVIEVPAVWTDPLRRLRQRIAGLGGSLDRFCGHRECSCKQHLIRSVFRKDGVLTFQRAGKPIEHHIGDPHAGGTASPVT